MFLTLLPLYYSCEEMGSCQHCLKKTDVACSWFVDPLINQAYCMDISDCDDLNSGTPASCTKGTFVSATFPDLSPSKAAREVCRVFPKKLKKQVTAAPTVAPPPTDKPTYPPYDCGDYRNLFEEDGEEDGQLLNEDGQLRMLHCDWATYAKESAQTKNVSKPLQWKNHRMDRGFQKA